MIRILLADDHTFIREALRRLFEETADLRVMGEAATADQVLERIDENSWDIVLLDLSMPGESGLALLRGIRRRNPRLPILVLSVHDPAQYSARVLRAGAGAYLPKDVDAPELLAAVRRLVGTGACGIRASADRVDNL